MSLTNRERIARGLDELKAGLVPFVERECKARLGAYWKEELVTRQKFLKLEGDEIQWDTQAVLKAMNMVRGVTHAEFIRSHEDGRYYFLEIAARVGGANIDTLIQAATGVQLWAEWAKIEVAHVRGERYEPPVARTDYAGLIVSLAKQEWPDLSGFTDPEIVWRLHKKHHAGLIAASQDQARVEQLLSDYVPRFIQDFLAVAPPKEHAEV